MRQVLFFVCALACTIGSAQTWSSVGLGAGGDGVSSFYVHEKMYMGGGYSQSSLAGNPFQGICVFDGVSVDSLGEGLTGIPRSMRWYNGKLITAGQILCANAPPNCIPATDNIAAWDSLTGWESICPNGGPESAVYAMEVYDSTLYIGGQFVTVNGVPFNRIAKWDGTTWSGVSGGVNGGLEAVWSMAVYHGQLYVGGHFTTAGNSNIPAWFIARWNGTQWDSVAGGLDGYVRAMVVDSVNDVLYVGGGFASAGGIPANGIACWNDTLWSAVGSGTDTLWGTTCLAMFEGELYAGGGNESITALGDTIKNVYMYNGVKWVSVAGGANATVLIMDVYDGNLYIGGGFGQVGYGLTAINIACYGTTCPTSVGIIEPPEKIPFIMFPNPNDDVLHITTTELGRLVMKIFSNSGQLVTQQTFTSQVDYETRGLAAGSYTVQVSLEDGSKMHSEVLIVK